MAVILLPKEDLKFILAIHQTDLKISKLLNSLSKILKNTNWIFLYDNVNNLYNISQYFPNVPSNKQKIITTTRNANIKDVHFLENKNIINIGILDKTEKTNNARCLKAICLADYAKLLTMQGNIAASNTHLNQALDILTPSDCFWKLQARVTVFNRYQACISGYYVATDELKKVINEGENLLKELQAKNFSSKLNSSN